MGWPLFRLRRFEYFTLEVGRDLESLWVLRMGGVDHAQGLMEGLLRSRSTAVLYRALAVQTEFKFLAPTGPSFLGW